MPNTGQRSLVPPGRPSDSGCVNRQRPDAECPLRPGEPCTLCQLDVSGPADCPLVYLVMTDDDLRAQLHEHRIRARKAAGVSRVY